LHPRYQVEREYAVLLDRRPTDADLERLKLGIQLDDGPARLLAARRGRRPSEVEPEPGDTGPWFRVRLGEGRNREVRRLFAAAGYQVRRLVRTRFGPVTLTGLPPAAWRPLTTTEVRSLEGRPAPVPARRSPRRRARRLRIAVDGTSGSGKSTVGRAVADRLGARFVDTGLLYRAVTLAALEAGVDPEDATAVARLARVTPIRVRPAEGGDPGEQVRIGRREVTALLREPAIERAVPIISRHAEVRAAMLKVQRDAASGHDTVMVGRDIGTVVLPDADLKVFLTASVDTRARRRAEQMGRPGRLDAYRREITERDRTDSTREVAPLRRAPGALVLDTGELDVEGCVTAILAALPRAAAR
jgi:cytidylate kinase